MSKEERYIEYINKNYVSKKKIREKIKYFQDMGKDVRDRYYYDDEIDLLEELLEE